MRLLANSIRRIHSQRLRRRIQKVGFWFVDVPRTGTTSLKVQMEQQIGWPYGKSDRSVGGSSNNMTDHTTAGEMRYRLGEEVWNSLYTFSFVRNPWDRVVSLFRYRQSIANTLPSDLTFRDYIRRLETPAYTFAEVNSPYYSRNFYWSAAEYLVDRNGNLLVNDVFRYEDRVVALQTLSRRLPIRLDPSRAVYTTSEGEHYSTYYDDETCDIVARHYWKDIEMFGYQFEQAANMKAVV